MTAAKRQILITAALPYANGEAHLGHMVEYLLPDFWARFQRMRGHTVSYVCATDDHGTPIMLRAQREGIEPEVLIARAHDDFDGVFSDFLVSLDQFHNTHSEENRELTEDIYQRNKDAGHIERRTIRHRRGYSYPIVSSVGPVPNATLRTSTAMSARSAARPTRPPNCVRRSR